MNLSILVVTYCSHDRIEACLRSVVRAADYARAHGGHETEVVVGDNGSSDGTLELVRERFPEVESLDMGANLGFAAAVNRCARASRGEVLWILNPDTEVPEDAVVRAAASLEAHPDAGAIGFRLVDGAGRFQLAVGLRPTLFSELARRFVQRRLERDDERVARVCDAWLARPKPIAWVAGAAMLVWRDAFDAVRGFDERYFLYFEDIDFCLRLGRSGRRVVFDPTLTITHHRGQSAAQAPGLAAREYRQSQRLFWEQHGNWLQRSVVGVYLALRSERLLCDIVAPSDDFSRGR